MAESMAPFFFVTVDQDEHDDDDDDDDSDDDDDDDLVAMWVIWSWVGVLSVLANCHQGVLCAPNLKIRINDADAEDDDDFADDYYEMRGGIPTSLFLPTEKWNWFS